MRELLVAISYHALIGVAASMGADYCARGDALIEGTISYGVIETAVQFRAHRGTRQLELGERAAGRPS